MVQICFNARHVLLKLVASNEPGLSTIAERSFEDYLSEGLLSEMLNNCQ
jgi:hypothetical protein